MSRRWGQVFLKSVDIQRKISQYILGLGFDRMMEIGPGTGALTKHIYHNHPEGLMMVEIDLHLVDRLRRMFPLSKIISGDFLEVEIPDQESILLFGNIPYYITTPIINRFLKTGAFKESVFMVQREYGDILLAQPKTRQYSSMTVLVNSFASVFRVRDVSRKHFYPEPKVDSSVVHMIKDKNGELDVTRYSLFLRKCFGMPRKTLFNNLRKHFESERILDIFSGMNIDPRSRPEENGYETFVALFRVFEEDSIDGVI